MPRLDKERHLILTSLGADGACCAALILRQYPKADILFTSARRIAWTLTELSELSTTANTLHICGVGIYEEINRVVDILDKLKAKGIYIAWYCGRGYLDPFIGMLSKVCHAAFLDCRSNTEAAFRSVAVAKDEVVQRLLDVAESFVNKEVKPGKELAFWKDLIDSASSRYLQYGDRAAFIGVVQKLAGFYPVLNADKQEVENYRAHPPKVLLGNSRAMERIRQSISLMGPIEEPVLILGPTGSGKEIAAHLLHQASKKKGAFIPVNCAILSTNADLAHDRLFGHVPGAYTGAKDSQQGAFEAADEGTLFLDEVAELPLPVQTQLLRVLEEGRITPLGTMNPRPVHVRVVAATNQDLPAMIRDGRFRMDLYHRLNILTLRIPPLRERQEDIASIAGSIVYELKKRGFSIELTRTDGKAVRDYSWPGNVRQLTNVLKRAAYLNQSVREVLDEEKKDNEFDMNLNNPEYALFRPASIHNVKPADEIYCSYIRYVHTLFGNNNSQAAKALKISLNTLKKYLE